MRHTSGQRVLAFPDGSYGDPDTNQLRIDDLGLLRGEGIFETILAVNGRPRELDRHLRRLATSAALLELPAGDPAGWRRAIDAVLAVWPADRECTLKLVHTPGPSRLGPPTMFVLGLEIDPAIVRQRETGISVVTLERGFGPEVAARAPWLLLGAKTLSYAVNMAALREAERRGADDVIFTATDGSLLEGPTSTVVVATGRTLRTPPAEIGILPGTTQAAVFDAAERAGWATKTEPLTIADLTAADAIMLVSSGRRLARVHTLDGDPRPESRAIVDELTAAYESLYQPA